MEERERLCGELAKMFIQGVERGGAKKQKRLRETVLGILMDKNLFSMESVLRRSSVHSTKLILAISNCRVSSKADLVINYFLEFPREKQYSS